MSVQDDLAAAVSAIGAEQADRDSKVSAVRDALAAVTSAVEGLKSAVDSLDGGTTAPTAPDDVPTEPQPDQPVPEPASEPGTIDPATGQPVDAPVDPNVPTAA